MKNWYFYHKNGERGGPISLEALKELASQGLVTRKTRLESKEGECTIAEDLTGLTFPDIPETATLPPPYPIPPPIPPVAAPNPFTAPPPVLDNPFTLPPPVVK